jgi:hypothetical protein
MSHSLKKRIAECCRRADEYMMLYCGTSNFNEREVYLSTTLQFLRLAESLDGPERKRRTPRRDRLEARGRKRGMLRSPKWHRHRSRSTPVIHV